MTTEYINKKIEEAHQNAIDHGFYDECDCNEGYGYNCEICNSTGSIKNKNIGELLMLIVSELGEALEAHRCGIFYGTLKAPDYRSKQWASCYEIEIADVFIRLFDLMGYLAIKPYSVYMYGNVFDGSENIGESLLFVTSLLTELVKKEDKDIIIRNLSMTIYALDQFCSVHDIPIQKHINSKMAYNKTRPRLHGKEY